MHISDIICLSICCLLGVKTRNILPLSYLLSEPAVACGSADYPKGDRKPDTPPERVSASCQRKAATVSSLQCNSTEIQLLDSYWVAWRTGVWGLRETGSLLWFRIILCIIEKGAGRDGRVGASVGSTGQVGAASAAGWLVEDVGPLIGLSYLAKDGWSRNSRPLSFFRP